MVANLKNRKAVLASNPFTKAVRQQTYIRAALVGMPGAGKTYTALMLASKLGQKVAFVDSEVGSASLYAGEFDFDTLDFAPPYHPDALVNVILAAEIYGYDVLVIDSLSHVWSGSGGMIDIADSVGSKGNKFAGWAKVRPLQQALVDTMLNAKLHIICTVRGKPNSTDKWVGTDFDSLGMAPDLRDELLYEFDFVGAMGKAHDLHIAKSRVDRLRGTSLVVPPKLAAKNSGAVTYDKLANELIAWANEGMDPALFDWHDADKLRAWFGSEEVTRYQLPTESDGDFAQRVKDVLGVQHSSQLAGVMTMTDATIKLGEDMVVPESAPLFPNGEPEPPMNEALPLSGDNLTGITG